MVFQLGQITQHPPEAVIKVYQSGKGRGWGELAKDLGIKPGSAEFHALKRGDLHYGTDRDDQPNHGKEKSKSKNKHNK